MALPSLPLWRARLPGLALAALVAACAHAASLALKALGGGVMALPAMVLALLIGVTLHEVARRPLWQPGIIYAVKVLLGYAIALLGFRIAITDIAALGLGTALLTVIAMAATLGVAMACARALGLHTGVGGLSGAANAICGASATLATATVVPEYRSKSADIAFTVVMANAISTVAMLAYPPLAAALGLTAHETGIMLGLTIQDMAQVVGAGFAVSDSVGQTAVIVKLFRIFLLLPTVLAIGWVLTRTTHEESGHEKPGAPRAPVPAFAIAFIVFSLANSLLPLTPVAQAFEPVKATADLLSRYGLLLAIAGLGLNTSLGAILSVGWRHLVVFLVASLTILAVGTGGILALRLLG